MQKKLFRVLLVQDTVTKNSLFKMAVKSINKFQKFQYEIGISLISNSNNL